MMSLMEGTWADEALRVMAVAVVLLSFLLLAELWRWWCTPPVEWTRKFVHVCSGLVVSCLPWIFGSRWSVLALGAILSIVMVGTRLLGLCASVHGVGRRSYGDIYYVCAVMILFLISEQQPVFFFISILTLTIADALAALLGSTYQRFTYRVEDHRKSLEGTLVFLTATFLIVEIPLLLLTEMDREQCILISVQVALIVACLEAICLQGIDNLIIPLATYYLLTKMKHMPASLMLWQLALQLAILMVSHLVSWWTNFFAFSSAIATYLFFYGAYSLTGPAWVVPPGMSLAMVMIVHKLLQRRSKGGLPERYQMLSVFYVSVSMAGLIFLDELSRRISPNSLFLARYAPFFVLYVGVVVAQLSITLFRFLMLHTDDPLMQRPSVIVVLILAGLSYCFIAPFSLWLFKGDILWMDLGITFVVGMLAPLLYCISFRHRWVPDRFPWEFRLQALTIGIAVAIASLFYM